MAYEKQNFVDGQVLTAAHLNHIEDGIGSAVLTVNGTPPDENGNVEVAGGSGGSGAFLDITTTRKDDVDGSGRSGLVVKISTETSDSIDYVYDGLGIDSATAETLEPGTDATAVIASPMGNKRTLKLGIPRGKSAYEYAQDGGYTGTEEEFTEGLVSLFLTDSEEVAF